MSWQWKSLVDSDELWIVLCHRLGWTLSHTVSPFDKSAWKRLYVDNIVSLKRTVAPQVRGVFIRWPEYSTRCSCLASVMSGHH